MAFEELAGSLADGVAYRRNGATALRAKPDYKYPVGPAVAEGNRRLKEANRLYNTLSAAEADLWTRYAERNPKTDPMTGARYVPVGKSLFVGLVSKCLQIRPDAAPPLLPPPGRFARQRLTIAVEPVGPDSLPLGRVGVGWKAPREARVPPPSASPPPRRPARTCSSS